MNFVLSKSSSILWLDVSENYAKLVLAAETSAEAEANRKLTANKADPMSLDTGKLTKPVYATLKNKFHSLPSKILTELHKNPSLNVDQSTMKEAI